MTGIGSGTSREGDLTLELEIRSVNHRFLDLSIRLPSCMAELETTVRERLQAAVGRGRVSLSADLERGAGGAEVEFDQAFVAAYVQSMRELGHKLDLGGDLSLSDVVRLEDAYRRREPEIPVAVREKLVDEALAAALEPFQQMRDREGEKLARDLAQRLDAVADGMKQIAAQSGGLSETLRRRLEERLTLARAQDAVDPQRLAAEVALLVDRATISEEVERMDSHLDQARECLRTDGPVAKRLGFLLQEMHREVNTMGSKSSLLEITNVVVRLKEELENMREQIQNLE